MKTIAFLVTGLLAAASFAGMNNLVVTFSSQGPDKYADGTTVLDGECYALVYTRSGKQFNGIAGDGTAIGDYSKVNGTYDNKVMIAAPIAKDGKCPQVQFQIDETYRNAKYPGGTWGVYLLDTRRYKTDEDGVITEELESVGNSKQVNGYGKVATLGAGNFTSAAAGIAAVGEGAKFGEGAAVKVKDIKFIDENVQITAEAPANSRVSLQAGDEPANLGQVGGEKYGDKEVIFITPKSNGNFFKVQAK